MKLKTYMISYSWRGPEGSGFGNVDAYSDLPLSMDVIRRWEESVREKRGWYELRIMNVVLLDE